MSEGTETSNPSDVAGRLDGLVRLADQCAYELAQMARGAKISDHMRKRLFEIANKLGPHSVNDNERKKWRITST